MKGKVVCFVALVASLAVACNQSKPAEQQVEKPVDTPAVAQQTNTPDFRDSIQYDTLTFPDAYDTSLPGKIITTGGFHGDEVWDNLEKDNWLGLFKSAEKHYIAATPVTVKEVFDPVLDEDSTKESTGREVNIENKDTCLLLLSHLGDLIQEHDVESVPLPVNEVKPGESITIRYKEVTYTLSATGEKRMVQENDEYIWNYKLYLTATKNGTTIKQLLAAFPSFDDAMVTLVFAGDIDGDGMLDLIMDTSNHYNVTVPTLYLSKPAAAGELLKIMGVHIAVGC